MAFSEPLYGGSPDEWVAGVVELRDRFRGNPFSQLDKEKCRHRVSPKTTLVRPPVTGKSAGCPAGKKADPIIISTFRGSPCRVGGKLHFPTLEWALWT